jgi:flagellar protein FliS
MNLAYQTPARAYRQNHVYTADRGTILLMLYQGAIDFLQKAKSALSEGDLAAKGTYVSKAHAIISEFLSSLNHEAGGDLSQKLEDLYRFMLDQLMEAHLSNDERPLEVAISLLETLKEGWEGAVVQARQEGLL